MLQSCHLSNSQLLKRVAYQYYVQAVRTHRALPAKRKHNWPKDDVKDRFIVPAPLPSPDNYTETPVYPPILDVSRDAVKRREREDWYKEMQDLNTVEEKIIKLNMPKYWGWKSYDIREGNLPYDPVPYAQFLTRTHVASNEGLPDIYDKIVDEHILEERSRSMENQIKELLLLEHEWKRQDFTEEELDKANLKEDRIARSITENIHRVLLGGLSSSYPHLIESQVDYEPRIEAFWFVGGLPPPYHIFKAKKGQPMSKDKAYDPVDRGMHYFGKPLFQVRHHMPLPEILPREECTGLEFPQPRFQPETMEYYANTEKHANEIPGFWPGDENEFGFISYHSSGHLATRLQSMADNTDALIAQAIFGSFGWLLTQACYQGFSCYNDITYPLINQMVITNGKDWSFSTYQLNTTCNNIDRIDENPVQNVCWITKPMKLYESIENGQVVGYNPEVIKQLIKFYSNVPKERVGVDMKPYLMGEKYVANFEHEDKRIWLEKRFKQMVANRPRHKLKPEIYHWEKIFKIDHNMRFIDQPKTWWEAGVQMHKRKLSDHHPAYIPKKLRPLVPSGTMNKRKGRWEKTYYPESPKDIPITYQKNTSITPIPNKFYKAYRGKNKGYLEWYHNTEGAKALREENQGIRQDEE